MGVGHLPDNVAALSRQDLPAATPLGAFLLVNRWKRNTPAKLVAYLDMREQLVRTATPEIVSLDCGANYYGKADTAILGVEAAIVSAAAGTPVVVHSGDRVTVQDEDAYSHVLYELRVETVLSPAEGVRMVETTVVGFYH